MSLNWRCLIFTETSSQTGARLRPKFVSDRVTKISVADRNMLEDKFNENEVWDAVCGCGGDKAPGLDGFNFKFIRRYSDIFKGDLLEAIRWFRDTMEISKGCNASFITLIPKVSDGLDLENFVPSV